MTSPDRQWLCDLTAWGDPEPGPPNPDEIAWLREHGSNGRIYAASADDLRRLIAAPPVATKDVSVPVFPHQRVRAWPAVNPGRPPGWAAYVDLDVALGRRHQTDAMIAAYSVPRQRHRLRQGAPVALGGVPMVLLVADVDRHDLDADPRTVREWQRDQAPALWRWVGAGSGREVYATRAGLRLIERLRDPFVIRDAGGVGAWRTGYLAWLVRLGDELGGLVPDPACADWARLHRLPRVVRDGARLEPLFHFASADRTPDGALPASPTPEDRRIMMRWAQTHVGWRRALDGLAGPASQGGPRRIVHARNVPPGLVRELAAAMTPISDGRHDIYLPLAGALLDRGVAQEEVVRVIEQVSLSAGDAPGDVRRRVTDAQTTIIRRHKGDAITGCPTLRRRAPAVAGALDRCLPARRHDQRAHLARLLADETASVEAAGPALTLRAARERIWEALVDSEFSC